MFMRLATLATVTSLAAPAFAQQSDGDVLFDLLKVPEILEIMREEGIEYGDNIGQDLFAGEPSSDWSQTVGAIYDYDVMVSMVREDFEVSLDGVDLSPMIEFFGSEQGQTIVGLEVSARRALLEEAVEESAKDMVVIARGVGNKRLDLVGEFIEVNNLIETNVAGALNSNLAFYQGLLSGNAFGGALTEDQILSDVWAQESDIRDNTTEWIYSFLYMAYTPLEDADLEAYIAFSQTNAGGHINRAMFESFDRLFTGISLSLGRAAAREMTSQDL